METVFDMTHVLTRGIVEREVIDHHFDDSVTVRIDDFSDKHLPITEWEANINFAKDISEARKEKRIRTIKKQIEKLESREIEIVLLEAQK